MRFKVLKQGGYNNSSIVTTGGNISGPLILIGNPSQPLEAANKSYVDLTLTNINAANLSAGIIPKERLPAFTGDIANVAGSNVFSLVNSGLTPGNYPKVTVDAKGRVTNGYTLVSSDLPAISFTKVIVGRPTTTGGYAITDALAPAGGTLTGPLDTTATQTSALHAATKAYVDSKTSSTNIINSGDIVRKVTATTPTGYLRVNGAELDKTTYAGLYAIIGDTYTYDTQPGNGKPWQQQYQINEQQSTDIIGWTNVGNMPVNVAETSAVVTNGYVYVIGGYNSTNGWYNATYRAPINPDGSLGAWVHAGINLPTGLSSSQAIVTKNRVYLLGGHTGSMSAVIYMSTIGADGILSAFTNVGSLPQAVAHAQAFITKSRVYLVAGDISTGVTTITYTAPINTDGTLGTWTTGSALPVGIYVAQVAVTRSRVYLISGHNGTTQVNTIYTATIDSTGVVGAWTSAGTFPLGVSWSTCAVFRNRIYMLGGNVSGGVTANTYSAPINADGTLGAWMQGTSLAITQTAASMAIVNGRIYMFGGHDGANYISTVYSAQITGGLNDYSGYFNDTIVPTESTKFRLPDHSYKELPGTYSYIKI